MLFVCSLWELTCCLQGRMGCWLQEEGCMECWWCILASHCRVWSWGVLPGFWAWLSLESTIQLIRHTTCSDLFTDFCELPPLFLVFSCPRLFSCPNPLKILGVERRKWASWAASHKAGEAEAHFALICPCGRNHMQRQSLLALSCAALGEWWHR